MGRWICAILAGSALLVVTTCPRVSRAEDAPQPAASVPPATERPSQRVVPAPEVNPNAVVWHSPAPPTLPHEGDVWVNPKDGVEMVYVGEGKFTLGTSDAQIDAWSKENPDHKPAGVEDEQPACEVSLSSYWMGRTEVTNAQYLRFVQETGHRVPDYWKGGQIPPGLGNFPVVAVDWEDARAYCKWAGGHLPTELQWEKAARGTDGRAFPWGNEWDANRGRMGKKISGIMELMGLWKSHGVHEGPAPVGLYLAGASPYGCLDMAGNVHEWCADWYDEDVYHRYAEGDVAAPASGNRRVVRGGSYDFVFVLFPWFHRSAHRFHYLPDQWFTKHELGGILIYENSPYPGELEIYDIGFRCARKATHH